VSGDNLFSTNTGNIGMGTTTPGASLHIAASVADPVLVLQDTGPASTQTGYISFWNNAPGETGWLGFGSPANPHFSISNARSGGDVAIFTGAGGNIRLATNVTAVTVTPAGSVGIGTQSPVAKLDVRGNIQMGNVGQYLAAAGEENLRIIRGKVSRNGDVLAGSGFSAVRNSEGQYTITFTTPFAGTPTTVATPQYLVQSDFNVAWIDPVSSSAVNVIIINVNSGNVADGTFHFIATGPR
jgi:hypothetical protein